jgi:outer membrane receptor protein involved in Fe transport
MADQTGERSSWVIPALMTVAFCPTVIRQKTWLTSEALLMLRRQSLQVPTINYSNINAKGRFGTGYTGFGNVATNFRQWWQTNVDVREQEDAYFRRNTNVTWNWADPSDLTPIYWDNPYFTRYENYESDNRDRYFGNVNATWKITNWLNILGRVSLDRWDQLTEERTAVGSIDIPTYNRGNITFNETNFDLLANLEKQLSQSFMLRGLVGTNIRRQRVQSISASTNGGLITPHFYALSNTRNPINAPAESDVLLEVDGVFAGATLTWNDQLTLDATIRRDKSTTLPEENNVYYYPSVSVGYVFSKLLPSATWLSYGKLRANYAQVGNSAPAYSLFDVYSPVTPFGSQTQYSVPGTRNNPNLKPELTKSGEIGVELAMFRNRLGLDFSYYDAQSYNQILPVAVSTATGYSACICECRYDKKQRGGSFTDRNAGTVFSIFLEHCCQLDPEQKQGGRSLY